MARALARTTARSATAPLDDAAVRVGLVHASDSAPGFTRRRFGRGFVYYDTRRRRIARPDVLARIAALAIPPAWTSVWICPDPRGHVQAVGRDARGRKQYRYHPRWREVRDATKYYRMLRFAQALPRIRRRMARDLRATGLPREKVVALVTRLLETTLIRVGNEEYARSNRSYGLTTLRDGHARVSRGEVRFRFEGKGGKLHEIRVTDRRLARAVRRCQELPGQVLFQYVDDRGSRRSVSSSDVNAYLREITGEAFTAKDFRTWAGTVLAVAALRYLGPADGPRRAKRNFLRAIEGVARCLGNTPAICRKSYVHPAVLEAYLDGSLEPPLALPASVRRLRGLRPEEVEVAALLHRAATGRLRPAELGSIA
jgi:DNA topoisomerase-1